MINLKQLVKVPPAIFQTNATNLYADITVANRFSRMKTMTYMILKNDLSEIDRANYTLSLAQIMIQNQTITESEYQAFINRLFLQLGEHIKLYTSGESDSVMSETAAAILGSITYSCDLVLSRLPPNIAIKRMLNEPIESIYFDGLKINRELILKALSMIHKIKRSRIDVMCVYYNNILNNDLERLVRSYDPKFDAKRNLTDIDYKMPTLNRSVCGIGGILHMLEELQTENNFVNSFPREMTSRLFKKYLRELAHPAGDMINLGQLCFEHSILSLMAGESTPSIPLSNENINVLVSTQNDGWYSALSVSHKLKDRAPERYIDKLLEAMRPHLKTILASKNSIRNFLRQ